MWRAAGQRDTDFSFTLSVAPSVLYSATMLAWLADNSSNLDKTVGFLDRRLADVAKIPRLTKPVRTFMSAASVLLAGSCKVLLNAARAKCSIRQNLTFKSTFYDYSVNFVAWFLAMWPATTICADWTLGKNLYNAI